MTVYLKDDFEADFGIFFSKISMISLKVSHTIDKFSKSLKEIEAEDNMEIEVIEDLGTVEIPKELSDTLFELTENLKNQIYFNSLAVMIFSFLEFTLIEYCRLIDSYIQPNKAFKDYRNFGLEKAKEYLKDNFDIDFGALANWEEISKFQRVRNLIVHNNAYIIKDYDKTIEEQDDFDILSKMNKVIEITSSGTIFIKTIDYVNETLEKTVELINDIMDKTKVEVVKKNSTDNKKQIE